MKKKKIWGITPAAIMVTSVIGSSTAVFAGEKTGGDIPPAQMAEVNQDKLLSEIDALADEYNRIYDSHIDLWDKLYDAYNSLEADYDFEDFDENTFIRSLKTMTEAEKDTLIADIEKLDRLSEEMDRLYEEVMPMLDRDMLFEDENIDPETAAEMVLWRKNISEFIILIRICGKRYMMPKKTFRKTMILKTMTKSKL